MSKFIKNCEILLQFYCSCIQKDMTKIMKSLFQMKQSKDKKWKVMNQNAWWNNLREASITCIFMIIEIMRYKEQDLQLINIKLVTWRHWHFWLHCWPFFRWRSPHDLFTSVPHTILPSDASARTTRLRTSSFVDPQVYNAAFIKSRRRRSKQRW